VFVRLVGTLKRAPRLLLGPDALMAIRGSLLSGPLGVLLQTRRLVRVLTACAFLYALATVLFTWYLVSR
jgi:hypothetical protein